MAIAKPTDDFVLEHDQQRRHHAGADNDPLTCADDELLQSPLGEIPQVVATPLNRSTTSPPPPPHPEPVGDAAIPAAAHQRRDSREGFDGPAAGEGVDSDSDDDLIMMPNHLHPRAPASSTAEGESPATTAVSGATPGTSFVAAAAVPEVPIEARHHTTALLWTLSAFLPYDALCGEVVEAGAHKEHMEHGDGRQQRMCVVSLESVLRLWTHFGVESATALAVLRLMEARKHVAVVVEKEGGAFEPAEPSAWSNLDGHNSESQPLPTSGAGSSSMAQTPAGLGLPPDVIDARLSSMLVPRLREWVDKERNQELARQRVAALASQSVTPGASPRLGAGGNNSFASVGPTSFTASAMEDAEHPSASRRPGALLRHLQSKLDSLTGGQPADGQHTPQASSGQQAFGFGSAVSSAKQSPALPTRHSRGATATYVPGDSGHDDGKDFIVPRPPKSKLVVEPVATRVEKMGLGRDPAACEAGMVRWAEACAAPGGSWRNQLRVLLRVADFAALGSRVHRITDRPLTNPVEDDDGCDALLPRGPFGASSRFKKSKIAAIASASSFANALSRTPGGAMGSSVAASSLMVDMPPRRHDFDTAFGLGTGPTLDTSPVDDLSPTEQGLLQDELACALAQRYAGAVRVARSAPVAAHESLMLRPEAWAFGPADPNYFARVEELLLHLRRRLSESPVAPIREAKGGKHERPRSVVDAMAYRLRYSSDDATLKAVSAFRPTLELRLATLLATAPHLQLAVPEAYDARHEGPLVDDGSNDGDTTTATAAAAVHALSLLDDPFSTGDDGDAEKKSAAHDDDDGSGAESDVAPLVVVAEQPPSEPTRVTINDDAPHQPPSKPEAAALTAVRPPTAPTPLTQQQRLLALGTALGGVSKHLDRAIRASDQVYAATPDKTLTLRSGGGSMRFPATQQRSKSIAGRLEATMSLMGDSRPSRKPSTSSPPHTELSSGGGGGASAHSPEALGFAAIPVDGPSSPADFDLTPGIGKRAASRSKLLMAAATEYAEPRVPVVPVATRQFHRRLEAAIAVIPSFAVAVEHLVQLPPPPSVTHDLPSGVAGLALSLLSSSLDLQECITALVDHVASAADVIGTFVRSVTAREEVARRTICAVDPWPADLTLAVTRLSWAAPLLVSVRGDTVAGARFVRSNAPCNCDLDVLERIQRRVVDTLLRVSSWPVEALAPATADMNTSGGPLHLLLGAVRSVRRSLRQGGLCWAPDDMVLRGVLDLSADASSASKALRMPSDWLLDRGMIGSPGTLDDVLREIRQWRNAAVNSVLLPGFAAASALPHSAGRVEPLAVAVGDPLSRLLGNAQALRRVLAESGGQTLSARAVQSLVSSAVDAVGIVVSDAALRLERLARVAAVQGDRDTHDDGGYSAAMADGAYQAAHDALVDAVDTVLAVIPPFGDSDYWLTTVPKPSKLEKSLSVSTRHRLDATSRDVTGVAPNIYVRLLCSLADPQSSVMEAASPSSWQTSLSKPLANVLLRRVAARCIDSFVGYVDSEHDVGLGALPALVGHLGVDPRPLTDAMIGSPVTRRYPDSHYVPVSPSQQEEFIQRTIVEAAQIREAEGSASTPLGSLSSALLLNAGCLEDPAASVLVLRLASIVALSTDTAAHSRALSERLKRMLRNVAHIVSEGALRQCEIDSDTALSTAVQLLVHAWLLHDAMGFLHRCELGGHMDSDNLERIRSALTGATSALMMSSTSIARSAAAASKHWDRRPHSTMVAVRAAQLGGMNYPSDMMPIVGAAATRRPPPIVDTLTELVSRICLSIAVSVTPGQGAAVPVCSWLATTPGGHRSFSAAMPASTVGSRDCPNADLELLALPIRAMMESRQAQHRLLDVLITGRASSTGNKAGLDWCLARLCDTKWVFATTLSAAFDALATTLSLARVAQRYNVRCVLAFLVVQLCRLAACDSRPRMADAAVVADDAAAPSPTSAPVRLIRGGHFVATLGDQALNDMVGTLTATLRAAAVVDAEMTSATRSRVFQLPADVRRHDGAPLVAVDADGDDTTAGPAQSMVSIAAAALAEFWRVAGSSSSALARHGALAKSASAYFTAAAPLLEDTGNITQVLAFLAASPPTGIGATAGQAAGGDSGAASAKEIAKRWVDICMDDTAAVAARACQISRHSRHAAALHAEVTARLQRLARTGKWPREWVGVPDAEDDYTRLITRVAPLDLDSASQQCVDFHVLAAVGFDHRPATSELSRRFLSDAVAASWSAPFSAIAARRLAATATGGYTRCAARLVGLAVGHACAAIADVGLATAAVRGFAVDICVCFDRMASAHPATWAPYLGGTVELMSPAAAPNGGNDADTGSAAAASFATPATPATDSQGFRSVAAAETVQSDGDEDSEEPLAPSDPDRATRALMSTAAATAGGVLSLVGRPIGSVDTALELLEELMLRVAGSDGGPLGPDAPTRSIERLCRGSTAVAALLEAALRTLVDLGASGTQRSAAARLLA